MTPQGIHPRPEDRCSGCAERTGLLGDRDRELSRLRDENYRLRKAGEDLADINKVLDQVGIAARQGAHPYTPAGRVRLALGELLRTPASPRLRHAYVTLKEIVERR